MSGSNDNLQHDVAAELEQIRRKLAGGNRDIVRQFLADAKTLARDLQRQNSAVERKRDTRRLILQGRLLRDMLERGDVSRDEYNAGLDRYLTSNTDRALFGLPPVPGGDRPRRKRRAENAPDADAQSAAADSTDQRHDDTQSGADGDAQSPGADNSAAQDGTTDQRRDDTQTGPVGDTQSGDTDSAAASDAPTDQADSAGDTGKKSPTGFWGFGKN